MQLNRTFLDILGYIKTIESLEPLLNVGHIKKKTKFHLKDKILHLVRSIITIKVVSKMKLTAEEKRIYKISLRPFILSDIKSFAFYYTYSFEYKLRMIKKAIFQKFLKSNTQF